MNQKSLKPSLRFKEFTDVWEQHKYSDLANVRRGLTYNPSNLRNNGITVLRSSNIDEDTFRIYDDDVMVDSLCINIPYLNNGDILITSANGSSRLVGKHAIINGIKPNSTVHGGFMLLAETKNPYFLNASMSSSWYSKFIDLFIAGGNGAIGNLNKVDLDNYNLFVPNNEEQLKIGQLFKNIDSLITLYQCKYEKLKKIKLSLLEKMFPKEDEKIPKLRFKEFTDVWNQRKTQELCSIETGKSNTQDQVDDGIYPFFIRSDVPVRSNKYLYDCEAVITIGDGNIGKVFHYVNEKFDLHQRCYKMADFEGILGKYFYFYFSTKFYERAMKMTAKATVDSVRLEMISEMDILFPSKTKEQQKISAFLTDVDRLITLYQCKYEKLKKIKLSLLEKMFV